ncbi:MAG: hypothetical protein U0Q16_17480 [Bryobacteraceae bacterium]
MLRYFAALSLLALPVTGQQQQTLLEAGISAAESTELPPGDSERSVAMKISSPVEPTDTFIIHAPAVVEVTLVDPSGNRITRETAERQGFRWRRAEGATAVHRLVALREGPAGTYGVRFAAKGLQAKDSASVMFTSTRDARRASLMRFPGSVDGGKVTRQGRLTTLTLELPQPQRDVIFLIRVSDLGAKVRLVRPDGRVFDEQSATSACGDWVRRQSIAASGLTEFTEWFLGGRTDILEEAVDAKTLEARLSAPLDETQLEVTLPDAKAGTYSIQVESRQESPLVEAVLIPCPGSCTGFSMEQLDKRYTMVGEPIAVIARGSGAYCRDGLSGTLRLEYRVPGAPLTNAIASIETIPVKFARGSDGNYRTEFRANRNGRLEAFLHLEAKKAAGPDATADLRAGDLEIHRLAARLQGLAEKAVKTPGAVLFDQLEVAVGIDVVIPGEYDISLDLESANDPANSWERRRAGQSQTKHLEAGKHTVTLSFPSIDLRRLPDGPLRLASFRISRLENQQYTDEIDTTGAKLVTAPYRRDQWSRGEIHGEEKATVSGMVLASSGKFRLVTVEWEAGTPGGDLCSWDAGLQGTANRSFRVEGQGPLRPGKQKIVFAFDGGLVAGAPPGPWHFAPRVSCDNRTSLPENFPIAIDPARFEPNTPALETKAQGSLRVAPGKTTWLTLFVRNKTMPETKVQASAPPPGMDVKIRPRPLRIGDATFDIAVTAGPDAKAGRHVLPLRNDAAGQSVTRYVLVVVE